MLSTLCLQVLMSEPATGMCRRRSFSLVSACAAAVAQLFSESLVAASPADAQTLLCAVPAAVCRVCGVMQTTHCSLR
jgi:hypothetical protein